MRLAGHGITLPVWAFTLLLGTMAHAAYPDRAVTLVTPYPLTGPVEIAGVVRTDKVLKVMEGYGAPSLTDVVAAVLLRSLPDTLEQPVMLERKPRMRALEGARYVAGAAPDGCTVLLSDGGEVRRHPRLYGGRPTGSQKSLLPIAMFARMPVVLISRAALPVNNVSDLVQLARSRPGQLTFGSAGETSLGQLAGDRWRSAARGHMLHVPYNGGTAAANGIIKNQIDVAFVVLPVVLPLLESGRMKLLAIADRERHPLLPQVPTIAESGLADFEVSGWFGLLGPAGTPSVIVARLSEGVAAAARSPETQRTLLNLGLRPSHFAPDRFRALVKAESLLRQERTDSSRDR